MRSAHRISVLFVVATLGALSVPNPTLASRLNLPAIVLELPDTTAPDNLVGGWLTLRLSNFTDTVAGLQLQLRLDRPDLVWFDLGGADFDTAGALLSGFEMVLGRDTAVDHGLYQLFGLANLPFTGPETPGFPPQGGDILVRIPFSTAPDPDPQAGLTCLIEILPSPIFSDPSGNVIGYHPVDTVPDTIYYHCTSWNGDVCQSWEMVDPDSSTYDSIYVYDYIIEGPDSTQLIYAPGSITLEPTDLLNCDFTDDGTYSVTDLTCLVNFLFRTPGSGCPTVWCDCDGSGNPSAAPNVADLTCMVAFLFRGGPPPGL